MSAEVHINDNATNETGAARKSKRKKQMEGERSEKGLKCRRQRVSSSTLHKQWLPRQSDGKYHCPHCPKTYSRCQSRNSHLASHSPTVCQVCKRTYYYPATFRKHLKKCGDVVKNKKRCKFCGGKFLNRTQHEKNCEERTDSWKQHVHKAEK